VLELVIAYGWAGELLAVEEAELNGLPAQCLVRGDLADDVVSGFVSQAGEGEGRGGHGLVQSGGLN
jgi:hypothetical protein